MNLEKYDLLVQKYIGDELSETKRKDFEQELESNIDLQAELKLYQNVESAVKDNRLELFKIKLNSIHEEILGNQHIYRLFGSKAINLLAASIVVLLTLGSIILFTFYNSNSTIDVFNEYYQPYEMSMTSRNVDSNVDTDLITATNYYTNLDFKNAKLILDDLKSMEGDNSQVLIMLGVSNMELNQLEDAKDNFIAIISANNPFYSQQAEWYLTLTYLKLDDKSNALLHLKSIVSDTGFYKEKAIELIKELD